MRRTIWRDLLVALAMLMVLVGAGRPRRMGALTGVASPEYQTRTYLFKLAPQGAVSMRATGNANWAADWAAADQIVNLSPDSLALDLVTSRNHTTYGTPGDRAPGAETDSSATFNGFGNYNIRQSHTDGSWPNRSSTAASASNCYSSFLLLWVPFEQYIPSNWTVTSATIRLEADGSNYSSNATDTLCAVAMAPADSLWYKGKRTEAAAKFVARSASWRNQVQPAYQASDSGSTRHDRRANGYPQLSAFVAGTYDSAGWSPPLDSRVRTLDFGPRSTGVTPLIDYTDGTAVSIDFKRPLQKMLSGEIDNNGLAIAYITYANYNGTAGVTVSNFEDAAGADSVSVPYLFVTVSSKPYDGGPWVGKEVGFSFVADGGYRAGMSWADQFELFGWRMTFAPPLAVIGTGSYMTADELITELDRGHEIGWMTRRWTAGGIAGNHPTNTTVHAYNTADGYNAIEFKLRPGGLDSLLAAHDNSGRDSSYFAAHRLVGKTIACPNNAYNHVTAVAIADSLGYLALRTTYGTGAGYALDPAPGDTAGANVGSTTINRRLYGLTTGRKFNALLAPAKWYDHTLFGTVSDSASFDSTVVRRNVRLCIEDCAVRGNQLWILYSHKMSYNANPAGGIPLTKMRWLLNVLNEEGNVHVAPLVENVRYLRRNAQEVAHPDYGGSVVWENRLGGSTGAAITPWVQVRGF